MSVSETTTGLGSATLLRRELCARNHEYARRNALPHCLSYGEVPVVAYEPNEHGHGNFLPETYAAILANPQWRTRLNKRHAQARTALPRNDRGFWCELDSCNSSDAVLMNVVCHPEALADGRVAGMLNVNPDAVPEFGYRPGVPLAGDKPDRTEVDM